MKIITNLLKDTKDERLVYTTAHINTVNPIVDRIMDDESVEGVVMTNKEGAKTMTVRWRGATGFDFIPSTTLRLNGAPILTNVSLTSATNYGPLLNRLATMTQISIKELDIFDEVLIVRLVTKKFEIMLAPDPEFNVIVVQHARRYKRKQHN